MKNMRFVLYYCTLLCKAVYRSSHLRNLMLKLSFLIFLACLSCVNLYNSFDNIPFIFIAFISLSVAAFPTFIISTFLTVESSFYDCIVTKPREVFKGILKSYYIFSVLCSILLVIVLCLCTHSKMLLDMLSMEFFFSTTYPILMICISMIKPFNLNIMSSEYNMTTPSATHSLLITASMMLVMGLALLLHWCLESIFPVIMTAVGALSICVMFLMTDTLCNVFNKRKYFIGEFFRK